MQGVLGGLADPSAMSDRRSSEASRANGRLDIGGTSDATPRPSRVRALVLANTAARFAWAEDYSHGWSDEAINELVEVYQSVWGTAELGSAMPSLSGDPVQYL